MSLLARDLGMKLLALLLAVLTASASLSSIPHRALPPASSDALEGGYAQWAAGEFLHALQPSPVVQEKNHTPRSDGPDGLAAGAPSVGANAPAAGPWAVAAGPSPVRGRKGPRFPTGPPIV